MRARTLVVTTSVLTLAAVAGGTTAAGARPLPAPAPAARAAADPPGVKDYTATSTVRLSGGACSGAYAKFRGAADTDRALILTNGHCVEPEPKMNEVFVDRTVKRISGAILDAAGGAVHKWTSTKVHYGTETDTDVALYQLEETYAQVTAKAGVQPYVIAEVGPQAGDRIAIVSANNRKILSCTVAGIVETLKEAEWIWKQSVRYAPTGCETAPGVSGSPVLNPTSGEIWAIHNTAYEAKGARCTLSNPCEPKPRS